MAVRMLVDGVATDTVSAYDRGLAYGDGLFESVRFEGVVAPLWQRHVQRLEESCLRLRLPVPDMAQLWREALEVTRDLPQAVVRISWTRGAGERGYAPPTVPRPTRIVAVFALPRWAPGIHTDGVRMRVCGLRLAEQPLLAGMKHLNRLEQVLARAEWNDPDIAEGVLCDSHGRVISATMANLFVVIDGELVTPSLQRCGIAGVARAEVLAVRPQARVGELTLDQLRGASEVFLSSGVRGIVPVRSLDDRHWSPGPVARELQKHWCRLGFTMMEQAA